MTDMMDSLSDIIRKCDYIIDSIDILESDIDYITDIYTYFNHLNSMFKDSNISKLISLNDNSDTLNNFSISLYVLLQRINILNLKLNDKIFSKFEHNEIYDWYNIASNLDNIKSFWKDYKLKYGMDIYLESHQFLQNHLCE